MRAAVYTLATVEPLEPAGGRLPAAEYELWREGYYRALQDALTVMDLAEVRWRLYLRDRRRRRAAEVAAALGVRALAQLEPLERCRGIANHGEQKVGQGGELRATDREVSRPIAKGTSAADFPELRLTVEFSAPLNTTVDEEISHSVIRRFDIRQSELPIARARIIDPTWLPWRRDPRRPCDQTSDRTVLEPSSSPRQRETTKFNRRARRV